MKLSDGDNDPLNMDRSIKRDSVGARKISCVCFELEEKTYVLILFMCINMFLFADQNLLAPNLTVIADEFGMTANERDVYLGGYISLGFFAVGGVISMIVGYLADRLNRKLTFAVAVCIGEFSCFLTYWVPTKSLDDFWYGLWLTRAITGISIGGAVPIQYSIFGDYFSEENRGKAVAFLQIAVGLGGGIGQGLAGLMSPDWRTPFLLVSIPAFFLVAVYVYTTNEPKRGENERANPLVGEDDSVQHTITWQKFKNLFSRPTFILILLQGVPGILPWGVGQVFLNDFLIVEKNLTSTEAALVIPIQGLGSGVSIVLAGILADSLWKADKMRWIPIIAGTTTILASLPMLVNNRFTSSRAQCISAHIAASWFHSWHGRHLHENILINITLPETRGTAFAFQSLFDDLGRGLGPSLVSILIVSAGSRSAGIYIGYTGWIPCGMVMLCIYFTLLGDIAKNTAEVEATRREESSEAGLDNHYFQRSIAQDHQDVESEAGKRGSAMVPSGPTQSKDIDL